MARVVYDEEVVGTVVVAYEVANVAVELVLRLLAYIELDSLGVIVEAVTEEVFELDGLRVVVSLGVFRVQRIDTPLSSSSARPIRRPT